MTAQRVGRRIRRLGVIVCLPSLLVAVGVLPLLAGGTTMETTDRLLSVMTGSAGSLSGAALVFHVAVLGVLTGCWLIGVGLLVDGLFETA